MKRARDFETEEEEQERGEILSVWRQQLDFLAENTLLAPLQGNSAARRMLAGRPFTSWPSQVQSSARRSRVSEATPFTSPSWGRSHLPIEIAAPAWARQKMPTTEETRSQMEAIRKESPSQSRKQMRKKVYRLHRRRGDRRTQGEDIARDLYFG